VGKHSTSTEYTFDSCESFLLGCKSLTKVIILDTSCALLRNILQPKVPAENIVMVQSLGVVS